jgi:cytochrome c-type biogenesis protein CcmH
VSARRRRARARAATSRSALLARRARAATREILALALVALVSGLAATAPPASAESVKPRASLPQIQRQVMCVTCKIPLMVADSPQADRERAFIEGLIAEGKDEAQIKDALVAQYGPAVLALPATHGFDLTAYLVPLAAVLALLATLAVLLPRWRRHARAQSANRAPAAKLGAAEASRLEADLERFD